MKYDNIEGIKFGEEEKKEKDLIPRIRLECIRHDDHDSTKPDEKSRLNAKGREHATESGKDRSPNSKGGFIYASPRERTLETAAREFFTKEDWISRDTSLEEILDHIMLPVGMKYKISELLNYKTDAHPEYEEIFYKHYKGDKDVLEFIYKDSDDLVKRLNDIEDCSYSRFAANLAKLIYRYIKILDNWNRVYLNKKDELGEQNEIQRFLGTHSMVLDSFLLKIIEKSDGRAAVKKFINELPSKNGIVGLGDGFSIILKQINNETTINICYKDNSWNVTPELIEDIIKDREELDSIINDNLSLRNIHPSN